MVSGSAATDWLVRGTRADLDRRAAEEVGAQLSRAAVDRGSAVLAVVGGRSVAGVFAHLAALELPWRRIQVFMADERLCPLSSPDSNWQVVEETLVGPLLQSGRLLPEHTHPFLWDAAAPDDGVAAYGREFAELGGRLDAVVLSAGEDGHTASLFPHHPGVTQTDESFLLVENAPKPPPRRISASATLLGAAEVAVLMLYGESKRPALKLLEDPASTLQDCPSKLVLRCPRGLVFTDL